MKKIIKYFLYITIGLIFVAWLFRFLYNKNELQKEKAISYILSDSEKDLIKDGDIILRRGHGLVSDYIVKSFNEKNKITHCGIIKKNKNKLEVIHSESSSFFIEDGIQKQNFDAFTDAAHKNSIIIVRYNRCEEQELKKITKRAGYYLKQKIPFAYICKPEDTTRMFCSEIVWHVFLDEFGRDVFLNNNSETNFYQFKNFLDTCQFDVVLNHQEKE